MGGAPYQDRSTVGVPDDTGHDQVRHPYGVLLVVTHETAGLVCCPGRFEAGPRGFRWKIPKFFPRPNCQLPAIRLCDSGLSLYLGTYRTLEGTEKAFEHHHRGS